MLLENLLHPRASARFVSSVSVSIFRHRLYCTSLRMVHRRPSSINPYRACCVDRFFRRIDPINEYPTTIQPFTYCEVSRACCLQSFDTRISAGFALRRATCRYSDAARVPPTSLRAVHRNLNVCAQQLEWSRIFAKWTPPGGAGTLATKLC